MQVTINILGERKKIEILIIYNYPLIDFLRNIVNKATEGLTKSFSTAMEALEIFNHDENQFFTGYPGEFPTLTPEEYQVLMASTKTVTIYRDNINIFEGVAINFQQAKAGIPPQSRGVDFDFTVDSDNEEKSPVEDQSSQDCIEVEVEPQLKRKSKYFFFFFPRCS